MTKPKRIQRKRTKGWRMPPNAVYVGRPSRWGNPCHVGMFLDYTASDAVRGFRKYLRRDPNVASFEVHYGPPPSTRQIRRELRGKDLACWCRPDQPCHADVLLEIANA